MSLISSENLQAKDIQEEISFQKENTPQKKERKYSSNSSDSDSFISNINAEIKNLVENEENLSFSSNSDQESPYKKSDIEYLLDSRFWKADKNSTYDNEYNPEKKFFGLKKSKNYGEKNGKSKYEDSNKQSTQGNEDEEMRYEPIHNMSSSETNNSHLNSLGNNENSENEINCDKNSTKEGKNASNNISNNFAEKNSNKEENSKFDLNIGNDYDNNNLMGTNLLFNGSNFTNNLNYNNINENSKFNYPYEPINYMSNQTGSNYYQNSYLSQNYMNFASNYNMASPIGSRNLISLSNNNNKISKNLNENNSDNSEQNVNNDNINGQNNKFLNSTNNGLTKKLNQNQKEIIDLPLILNQNNSPNSPINYNIPKLNLNMTYYPKIQNRNLQIPKQSMDKSISSNLLPELKDSHNSNINNNFNFPDKKTKNNNIAVEINSINNNKNNSNGNNSYNFTNNKMKTGFNKNMNNANNNIKGQKGEKQILNLDDIVSGKDTRTTIMIRNIPIKYTDEILNEALKEFQGKYDCLYMPYDYEKNGNKGYAFINFVNPLHILLFYERFNGSKWQHFESPKICELNMAHFQGVNEIQKHAKNFKGLKKPSHNSINENIIIPSKYLSKFKIRFPNMKYENKNKKEFVIKSFE